MHLIVLVLMLVMDRLHGLSQDNNAYKRETSDEATAAFLSSLPTAEALCARCRAFPAPPNISAPGACLGLTNPVIGQRLAYPADAEAHFLEVERALARWKQKPGGQHKPHRAAGYAGPWIENHWIAHFESMLYRGRPDHSGGLGGGTFNFGSSSSHAVGGGETSLCLRDVFGPFVPLLVPWVDRWLASGVGYPQELRSALVGVLRKDVPYVTVRIKTRW